MGTTGKIIKIAGGKIIETAKKDIIYSAGGSITNRAALQVKQTGQTGGVIYGDYKELKLNTYIDSHIWCDKNKNTFPNETLPYNSDIYALLYFTDKAIGEKASIEVYVSTAKDPVITKTLTITGKEVLVNFTSDKEKIFLQCTGSKVEVYLKIKVKNEMTFDTNKKLYTNRVLTIHFVILIPSIMESMGWTMASKSQEDWFTGKACNYPWESNPRVGYFKLDDLLKFERFKEYYNKSLNSKWKTENAIKQLREEIKKMVKDGYASFPTKNFPITPFNALGTSIVSKEIKPEELKNEKTKTATEKMPFCEKYYYQSNPYIESKFSTLDDFYGTIANCNIRFCAKGVLTYNSKLNTPTQIEVTLTQIGVYIKDGFDYSEDQPLGYWTYQGKDVSRVNILNIYINNKSYRDYRDDTEKGQDSFCYSDIKIYNVNHKFNL